MILKRGGLSAAAMMSKKVLSKIDSESGSFRDLARRSRTKETESMMTANVYGKIADWREGSHRKACRSYESASLTLKATAELSKPIFTVRERAFIRALLYHDYTMHASSICKKQVEFMAAHPTCDLRITLFDYCAGHLQIEVHSAAHSPLSTVLQEAGEEWTDFIARAVRSEGRFQLHVMRVLDGTATPHWVIPLRCSGSYMFDHLRDLAQQPINEGIMDEISDLLEEDQDVVVIH
ncbi:hypothetical protein C8R44DRAFT_954537 [Mycena epipterygia]|nr:hypothetical protein C8R44DRAFT_954537 [Mycena epipterygia]